MIRRIIGGLALAIVALGITAAPAVSAPHKPGPTGTRVTLAAHAPTVSPAPEHIYYNAQGVRAIPCASGRLCVDVWDPTRSTYKVFVFYQCKTYSLSWFYNTGIPEIVNNQTGNVRTRFLKKDWTAYLTIPAKQSRRGINWDPVWYIDVC